MNAMSTLRHIAKTVSGQRAIDGAGVQLIRVIGHNDVKEFDPFLLLDAFDSRDPKDYIKGFPWHPHRGIETFTYLVEGKIEHGDSLGNKGVIRNGEAQWMSAGSGIIHQEMPQPSDHMLGLQLWVNLPKSQKMSDPIYRDLNKETMLEINGEDNKVRLIAGEYAGRKADVHQSKVEVRIMDVQMDNDAKLSIPIAEHHTLFIYVFFGKLEIGNKEVPQRHAVLLKDGDEVSIRCMEACRFMWFEGAPLKEPIAWGGPIVMNTQQELQKAFDEIDEGTFLKHASSARKEER
jgi:redox-sensitive bicupin YhaK (pirin superfamily)